MGVGVEGVEVDAGDSAGVPGAIEVGVVSIAVRLRFASFVFPRECAAQCKPLRSNYSFLECSSLMTRCSTQWYRAILFGYNIVWYLSRHQISKF